MQSKTDMLEKFRIVPMAFVMGTIFFLSHQQGDVVEMGYIPGLDKIAHFLIYGLLAATVIFAHGQRMRNHRPLLVVLSSCIVCLLYGMTDEFHQSFIPGRFVSGADVLADVIGAIVVSVVWLLRYRKHFPGKKCESGRIYPTKST